MQSFYIFIKTIVSFGDTFPVQEVSRLIICCSIICFNLFPFIILLLVSVFLLYSLVFILVLDCHGHFIVRKPSNKGSEMNWSIVGCNGVAAYSPCFVAFSVSLPPPPSFSYFLPFFIIVCFTKFSFRHIFCETLRVRSWTVSNLLLGLSTYNIAWLIDYDGIRRCLRTEATNVPIGV
jgi:hypothetical protein